LLIAFDTFVPSRVANAFYLAGAIGNGKLIAEEMSSRVWLKQFQHRFRKIVLNGTI